MASVPAMNPPKRMKARPHLPSLTIRHSLCHPVPGVLIFPRRNRRYSASVSGIRYP